MAGATVGGQVQPIDAFINADGIHPNDAGNKAISTQQIQPIFSQIKY